MCVWWSEGVGSLGRTASACPACRWAVPAAKLDWPKFMAKKRAELERLNSVYGRILGGANVETLEVCSPNHP